MPSPVRHFGHECRRSTVARSGMSSRRAFADAIRERQRKKGPRGAALPFAGLTQLRFDECVSASRVMRRNTSSKRDSRVAKNSAWLKRESGNDRGDGQKNDAII